MIEPAIIRGVDFNNSGPLRAGTHIQCENGHLCVIVTDDIEVGDMDYARKFEWKQKPPRSLAPFPIRCELCDAVLFAANPK